MVNTTYLTKKKLTNFIELFGQDEKMFTPEQRETIKGLPEKLNNGIRFTKAESYLVAMMLPHLN